MNLGIIGTGGFSRFSVNAFLKTGEAEVKGAFDIDTSKAKEFRDQFGGKIYQREDDIYKDAETELIYIATPPFLHYEQSKKALMAGKHVICEKPAAIRSEEAKELVELSGSKNLLYTVNLMQRYNPLFAKVKQIIDDRLLGEFLHGFFENYAADEGLGPGHWMWDETRSGGIFIEHAVHFFDLFEGWLGPGKVVSSQKIKRPGTDKVYWSRVQAIVKYEGGLVNFYHGFDQPADLDRQELRLEFERGDITLYEWIPTKIKIYGLVGESALTEIKALFPGAGINVLRSYSEKNNKFKGRFKEFKADHEVDLVAGTDIDKMERYSYMNMAMFADQAEWIRNPDFERTISGVNGYNSLKMAEDANIMAVKL